MEDVVHSQVLSLEWNDEEMEDIMTIDCKPSSDRSITVESVMDQESASLNNNNNNNNTNQRLIGVFIEP